MWQDYTADPIVTVTEITTRDAHFLRPKRT